MKEKVNKFFIVSFFCLSTLYSIHKDYQPAIYFAILGIFFQLKEQYELN